MLLPTISLHEGKDYNCEQGGREVESLVREEGVIVNFVGFFEGIGLLVALAVVLAVAWMIFSRQPLD